MEFFTKRQLLSSTVLILVHITVIIGTHSHHMRHHRDRLKRQQKPHLYLPGSYVTDNDHADAGPWKDWSKPSACSRSCGGGVSTQYRGCTPGYTCQGPTKRHFSCNTQDCPDSIDFRSQQCSDFDMVPFQGDMYQWVPYKKATNPCELTCMPRGKGFYYRHQLKVKDGTRCTDDKLDVCVEGKCHHVGCDMMLGSDAKEDKCGNCGGDGSSCVTVTGLPDMPNLQMGYNDTLLIPTAATNITLGKIGPSNSYLVTQEPQTTIEKKDESICFYSSDPGNCTGSYTYYHFDSYEWCSPFEYTGCGGNANKFVSEEECERKCGRFLGQDVCQFPGDAGPCRKSIVKFYYDSSSGRCHQFAYGGCEGNGNRFSSLEECKNICEHEQQAPNVTSSAFTSPPIYNQQIRHRPVKANITLPQTSFDVSSNISIPCDVDGYPIPQVQWFKDNVLLVQSHKTTITTSHLMISKTDKSDSGIYKCEAYNQYSRSESIVQVVIKLPVKTNITLPRNSFGVGSNISIPCDVDGYPIPQVQWFKNNVLLVQSYKITMTENNRLMISKTQVIDSGIYKCEAHNQYSRSESVIQVVIKVPVKTNITLPQNSFGVDSNISIPCDVDGYPIPHVQWFKNNVLLVRSHRIAITETHRLMISKTDKSDSGIYKCEAHNQYSRSESVVQVVIKALPQNSFGVGSNVPPISPGYYPPTLAQEEYEPVVTAREGDIASLKCAIRGNPNPKFSWRKENLIIDGTQARYIILSDGTLQVVTLHKSDSGIYLCIADNSIGNPLQNNVRLNVTDGVQFPAKVLEVPEEKSNVIASLDSPTSLNCYVLGFPFPSVTWWRDDRMILMNTSQYEQRKDYSLQINKVSLSDLGIYICQVYNGIGNATSLSVAVKTMGPVYSNNTEDQKYMNYVVDMLPLRPHRPSPSPGYSGASPTPQYYIHSPAAQIGEEYLVPVKVNITLPQNSFDVGNNISIPCVVDGYPIPQVQWFKDNVPLIRSHKITITENHRLMLSNTEKSDSGIYKCEAHNQYSRSDSVVQVIITIPVKATIILPQNSFSVDSNISIPCDVDGYPIPHVQWFKDNSSLIRSQKIAITESHRLMISKTDKSDSGIYKCEANNQFSRSESVVQVVITVPVKANITLPQNSFSVGSNMSIPCDVDGYPIPQVQWFKDNVPLVRSHKITITENHRLMLEKTEISDSGTYKCEANNQHSRSESVVQVAITVPVKANITLSQNSFSVGSNISIPCDVVGNPIPAVQWFKDNVPLVRSQKITITESHQLIVSKTEKSDSGIYKCEANNQYTRSESVAQVLITVPVKANITLPQNSFSVGSNMSIPCDVDGYPIPQVQWFKDNVPLVRSHKITITEYHRLMIVKTEISDSGSYKCEANNQYSRSKSVAQVVITVPVKANIRLPQNSFSVGSNISIPCDVDGYPIPQVQWFKDNVPLVRSHKITISESHGLKIANTEKSESGIYKCEANNQYSRSESVVQVVITVPVKANITLPQNSFTVGSNIGIPCNVDGYPIPQVQWFKDNVPLVRSDKITITENHRLMIEKTEKFDSGIYKCEAHNQYSRSESVVQVIITIPVKATVTLPQNSFNEGSSISIPCDVDGYPIPQVQWFKDNVPLVRSHKITIKENHQLMISKTAKSDSGIYKCEANNQYSRSESVVQVIITIPVKATVTLLQNSFDEGSIISIPCVVDGYPIPQVQWFKDNVPLVRSHKITISENHQLMISKTAKSDSGIYKCEANNQYSRSESVVQVIITIPVKATVTLPQNSFDEGSSISIPCVVNGYPIPQVQWFKDNVPLVRSHKITISENHQLMISNTENSDSGIYKCEAKNQYSRSESVVQVDIVMTPPVVIQDPGIYINSWCTDNPRIKCWRAVQRSKCHRPRFQRLCCKTCREAGY